MLTLCIFLVAATINGVLLYPLGFLILTLGLLSMTQTNSQVKNLVFENGQSDLTPEGQKVDAYVTIRNLNIFDIFNISAEWRQATFSTAPALVNKISGGDSAVLKIPLVAGKRGKYRFPKLRLTSRFPFGTCYAWKSFTPEQYYIIYPAPDGHQPLPRGSQEEASNLVSDFRGEDFFEYRNFRNGDSPRAINWRAHARGLPLLTKVYASNPQPSFSLNWDHVLIHDTEKKLQQLSLWIEKASQENAAFSLELPNGTNLIAGSGPAHRLKALEFLAVFDSTNYV